MCLINLHHFCYVGSAENNSLGGDFIFNNCNNNNNLKKFFFEKKRKKKEEALNKMANCQGKKAASTLHVCLLGELAT